jgi:hypothetical protein
MPDGQNWRNATMVARTAVHLPGRMRVASASGWNGAILPVRRSGQEHPVSVTSSRSVEGDLAVGFPEAAVRSRRDIQPSRKCLRRDRELPPEQSANVHRIVARFAVAIDAKIEKMAFAGTLIWLEAG